MKQRQLAYRRLSSHHSMIYTWQAAHAGSGWKPQEWKGQGHSGDEDAEAAPAHEENEWGIEVCSGCDCVFGHCQAG